MRRSMDFLLERGRRGKIWMFLLDGFAGAANGYAAVDGDHFGEDVEDGLEVGVCVRK